MFPRIFLPVFAAVAALAAPLAPLLDIADAANIIADNFNVVLKPMSDADFLSFLDSRDQEVVSNTETTFSIGDFKGFSGVFGADLINILLSLTEVAYIEPVTKVKTSAIVTQSGAAWGLGRISHRQKGATNYIYDSSAGSGTYAYVIDTGIYTQHQDFEGRATFGANFAGDNLNADGNGHGTHVAGTM
jgi:subtilisin family serine protease